MRWSYTIGRIGGTEVKVHVTFLLLLVGIAYQAYGQGGTAAAVSITVFFVSFFFCIVLHEFGHITMARRFGVRTPDVILLPIGGVARLERIPEEPKQEILIALAGPAVTLAIIVGLALVTALTGQPLALSDPFADQTAFTVRLLEVNVWVLLFNLIPAFPLDGDGCFARCWPIAWGSSGPPGLRASSGSCSRWDSGCGASRGTIR